MKLHNVDGCYCNLFDGPGMPKGAICKPCFEGGCVCEDTPYE